MEVLAVDVPGRKICLVLRWLAGGRFLLVRFDVNNPGSCNHVPSWRLESSASLKQPREML